MKKNSNHIPPIQNFPFLLIFLLFSFYGFAQNPERKYSGYEKGENSVTVSTGDGEYLFVYYTPEIVETSFIPSGEEFIPESYAVILEPQPVQFSVKENKDSLTFNSEGINITILKNPFQVIYYFNGEKVTSEKSGYSKGKEHEKLDFNIGEDEMLFGGGARALGMNRRGNRIELYNRAHYGYEETSELMNFTLPIVFSSEKYMIHFDNAPSGFLDLDSEKTNTVSYETISGRKTYQLIVGESWEKLIENYTLLTGRQPMPPRWAFDNFSGKYQSLKEVSETIPRFKEDLIPVDILVIPGNSDVSQSWENLKYQHEIALQMGMQGQAYMHSDIGGFAGDDLDDELYVRWLQYGVFQPIFRPHGQEEVPSEPLFREPATKELAKKAIELRYRLLPYNYTLAFENSRNGLPLMRPLFFEEPENREIYNVANTYLWGKEFLISPVMDNSVVSKDVYFPGNDNWFDFYSGSKYEGGSTHSISVKEDHIPTFVRGGAFIPMAKPVQNTANYSAANLEVHYYYDSQVKESKGTVYHDDGKTPDSFEKGKYEILNLSGSNNGNTLTITVEKEEGENSDSQIQLVEVIIENLKRPVDVVWVKTLRFTSKNFMHQGKLVIPVRFDEKTTTIKLEFN